MSDNVLEKKRILFICPYFHSYNNKIERELTNQGAYVKSYNHAVNYPKLLYKLFPKFLNYIYFNKILKNENINNYDYIFVIKGTNLSQKFLLKLEECKALKVLYLWDAVNKYPHILEIAKYFDKVISFDSIDAKKYSFKFLPLFFSEENQDSSLIKYDLSFIGVVHSSRYQYLNKIKCIAKEKNLEYYIYMYLTNKVNYFMLKYIKKIIPLNARITEFQFKSLDTTEVNKIYDCSKIIVDFQSNNQSGLTMRTIEALGKNKKIITNNQYIREYDFFDSNNILILSENLLSISDDFFNTPYKKIDCKIKNKYYLRNWVKEIFDNE